MTRITLSPTAMSGSSIDEGERLDDPIEAMAGIEASMSLLSYSATLRLPTCTRDSDPVTANMPSGRWRTASPVVFFI